MTAYKSFLLPHKKKKKAWFEQPKSLIKSANLDQNDCFELHILLPPNCNFSLLTAPESTGTTTGVMRGLPGLWGPILLPFPTPRGAAPPAGEAEQGQVVSRVWQPWFVRSLSTLPPPLPKLSAPQDSGPSVLPHRFFFKLPSPVLGSDRAVFYTGYNKKSSHLALL